MRNTLETRHSTGVIVTGGVNGVNNLGVVRSLGKRGVPILLLSSEKRDIVRYSRYVSKKITYPNPSESEDKFIDFLLQQGKRNDEKYVIIPTRDVEVLALSKYKKDLEQFYLMPVPPFEIVEKFVNKKLFYQWLDRISAPHPKTYFANDVTEFSSIGREIPFPYIIKPAYVHLFGAEFNSKCLVINSHEELDFAIGKLKNKNIDVFIQDIIPGNELYSLSTYLNRKSEPLLICGYDKIRQYPPDFGIGSLWKSNWRSGPIALSIKILKAIQYYGIAEPEFKKDPRDGEYKMLEINARSIVLNSLPAACGADITYTAYLDTIGKHPGDSVTAQNGIIWIDEVYDILSCLKQMKAGKLGIKEILKSWQGKKVSATFIWSDPLPFFTYFFNIAFLGLKKIFSRKR